MPYNKGATKAMNNFKKEYGANWKSVYFALANKRAGKGLKGQHRGHRAANKAFVKGKTWSGHKTTVRSRGRTNVSRSGNGVHVHVRVR